MRRILQSRILILVSDLIMIPISLLGAIWFRLARFMGLKKLHLTRKILFKVGVFPIVNHYYEPRFDFSNYQFSKSPRNLKEINFSEERQLQRLEEFSFQEELASFPLTDQKDGKFFYKNGSFPSGDAEAYYSIIRVMKPKLIIEVGSGFSTLMALNAVNKNRADDAKYACKIRCIEPFEMPWLEENDIEVIRKKVEDTDLNIFGNLKAGDILFIDSSHVIRPGGDVLFEIFEMLPVLNVGVLIHFHDIFTPLDYPESWFNEEFRMWNEQYLLESFLTNNENYEVICGMSYLNLHHRDVLNTKFPILASQPDRVPGSIWLKKVK